METKPAALETTLVQDFVRSAHADLDHVKELLAQEPALINSTWDWGGGDWETGLGGAAHMGRRDIALYLLENGARLCSRPPCLANWRSSKPLWSPSPRRSTRPDHMASL